jgi:hypothetical protein
MRTMKRYLIPILIIMVLASGSTLGCSQNQENSTTVVEDKGSWTEKQVIDYLYEYLIDKARQLQGAAQAKDIIIGASFRKAIIEATRDMTDEDDIDKWGELITENAESMQEMSIWAFAWTGALKRLADYDKDGWWSVIIGDSEWRVNERKKEVAAWNDEAAKLLEEITLETYYNSRYGYYLDYPPSWLVNDKDMSNVWIYPSSPEASEAYIFIHVISEEELAAFEGLLGYIATKLSLLQSQCYEFEVTEATPPRIDYTYRLLKDSPRHEANRYFVQYGSKVYEIVCSAELTAFTEHYSLSPLYDQFESFRFQP